MEVCVGVFGHVIVEDDIDALNIHPATEQIRRDEDTLLEVLELLVPTQSAKNKKAPDKRLRAFLVLQESE